MHMQHNILPDGQRLYHHIVLYLQKKFARILKDSILSDHYFPGITSVTPSSSLVFRVVPLAQSLVFCVVFCR